MAYKVPEADELSAMLEMLFGREPTVAALDAPIEASHSATYVDPEGATVALCHCDLDFAAYSACALSMIPAEEAQGAVAAGSLSEMMLSNLHEVMNIFSNLLMSSSTPHLKLSEVQPRSDVEDVAGSQTASFNIQLGDYGSGSITFAAT